MSSGGLRSAFSRILRRTPKVNTSSTSPSTSTTAHKASAAALSTTSTTHNNNNNKTNAVKPTTLATKMAANKADQFIEFTKERRTYYALTKDLGGVTHDRIKHLISEATLHTPSSFNTQSNRLLVLIGAEHDKFWDTTTEILRAIVPADAWQHTADRMAGFKAGAGTILFFDDDETVKAIQEKFPMYADKFPTFATESLAIQQFYLWTALELEGLGANLQHYSPLVDLKVQELWGVPTSWKLDAQLVFGGRAGEPGPKEFKPVEERVKYAGF
jgi:predicted oxidoreductase (fatty acid repression mutant protein)